MAHMLGIHFADWITLGIYFVITIGVGIWTARKVADTADYFMAGRRFGKIFMVFFAFGAGTSGNDAVGVSSKTYVTGLSGIWWQWLWLFCTPFYWLIAPVLRRMRCLTTGDFFQYRYDGGVATLYTVVGIMQLTINIGIIQLGAGSMIEALSDGAIHRNWAIVAMTIMFVIYGMAGGLAAAIVTDFIQGILTVILSFILLPFALQTVGGFAGLHEGIQNEEMFKIVAPGEINGFMIAMLCTSALLGIVTQPHIMGVCAAGRTEFDGRVGFAGGNLLKRFCTIAWTVVGLCAVVMYMDDDSIDPDLVYGMIARDELSVLPGLVGVFMAALIASVMSSCDAFMVSCSGLFTQNIYRRFMVQGKSEAHYVWVGRIAALVIVVSAIVFAFAVSDVPKGLLLFFKLQALMAPAFWLGLFWRRTTIHGAWMGTLVGFALFWITGREFFHTFAVNNLPDFMLWEGAFRESWQIFVFLSGGFLATIVVSLLTPRVSEPKLKRFYECVRTPVIDNEPHHPEPFTLPEGAVVPHPPKIINHPDWEIYYPSKESVVGFLFFWAWVIGLIAFVYWMATWGA